MSKCVQIPLNKYLVEMVNPEKCIRYRGSHSKMIFGHIESNICESCFLYSGDYCKYETIDVEYATGEYNDSDGDKVNFEQFCCPNCGELISQHSTRYIEWKDVTCEKCKSEFVCLKDDYTNSVLILARKPVGDCGDD